jgi:hypothetical protein
MRQVVKMEVDQELAVGPVETQIQHSCSAKCYRPECATCAADAPQEYAPTAMVAEHGVLGDVGLAHGIEGKSCFDYTTFTQLTGGGNFSTAC